MPGDAFERLLRQSAQQQEQQQQSAAKTGNQTAWTIFGMSTTNIASLLIAGVLWVKPKFDEAINHAVLALKTHNETMPVITEALKTTSANLVELKIGNDLVNRRLENLERRLDLAGADRNHETEKAEH
ncbi:MAG: hypothetical protein A3E01_03060 [Gammaproteobacteria bacterium RIFCSPHIGHO2_12_FULL_63_22]|nr:MAG: hypothetical protein A3E01_03060 [Gammaproteobacteria bacterium RIFCSPHIGHO2_12_FULL_63_22]